MGSAGTDKKKTLLGWVDIVSPSMAAVNGTEVLGNMRALSMLVQKIEAFNKASSKKGGGYCVETVALTLHRWTLRRARGGQTNTRVFWDRRKAKPSNPRQEYGTILEALSDKEVVVTLNNWNFQSDKGTTIKVLEKRINPYPEW